MSAPHLVGTAQLRICLVAPSGSGKSTVAGLLSAAFTDAGKTVRVHKLAQPLYEVQSAIYERCNVSVSEGRQHHGILEAVATFMREIRPTAIVDHFVQRVAAATEDVVINDDLRDDRVDLPVLRSLGFLVVKVSARPELIRRRLSARGDLHTKYTSTLDEGLARIVPDAVIVNDRQSHDRLRGQVDELSRQLLHGLTPHHAAGSARASFAKELHP